jgi:ATP-dependent helicase HrpB
MLDLSSTGLPLVPFLPQISELLHKNRALALVAEPGAGKSTLVPPALMDEPWLGGRSIIMLEPRRVAALSIASRIAELLGEPVGKRAGYAVRTASRMSRETRILVVTEALLTRRIQEDPLLDGVALVILDEFHERSIHADLALALSLEVSRARPGMAILVMSATLEAEPLAALLGSADSPAPTLHCPGRSHPVQTRYWPLARPERWEEGFADAVARLFDDTEEDMLAFLPGVGEIRRVGGRLSGLLGARADVLPLHGMMRLEEQSRVIRPRGMDGVGGGWEHARPGSPRRIILATSIAETSLTVPGVRTVADSGWARLARFHHATGLDRLVTERVSGSSAEQRRGRAGRLGPGLCVRFWAETEHLIAQPDPEILRSDLAGTVLECALWGARAPGDLHWLDAPSGPAWSQAWELLRMLGLLDTEGATPLGKNASALGLPPRLAVLVLRGVSMNQRVLAAACAALLEERDGSEQRDPDFRLRLETIRTGRGGGESWRRAVATEMERILRRSPRAGSEDFTWSPEQEERVGDLLAFGFPDRLARREPDGSYRLVTGRVARFPGSGPAGGSRVQVASRAAAPWITAPDADAGETSGVIRLAAPVDRDQVDSILAQAAEETREIRWEGLVPKGVLARRVGRLTLTERPMRPGPEEIAASFLQHLGKHGLSILPWNARSTSLLARLRFYARQRPESGLGEMTEEALAKRAGEWLHPFLSFNGGQVLSAGELPRALHALAAGISRRFESEVPEWLVLPTGGKRSIDYQGDAPSVEARIQEVFGLAQSPRVLGMPVAFKLLSPARRPLQITSDLAGFWRTTYAEVRKEMRGRYPKHYWPEDPLRAEPTAGVRPKKSG